MRHFQRYALLAAFLMLAVNGSSQKARPRPKPLWEPPSIKWPETGNGGSVIDRLTVGGFTIILDQTPLQEARRILGGTISSRGDAGDAEGWLCYRGSDQIGPWIFWLTSAEINGNSVGGFIWKRAGDRDGTGPGCRLLRGDNPIMLQLPLQLGMDTTKVESILGRPTSVRDLNLFYMNSREETIKEEQYTVSNGTKLCSRDGVIVQIAAFEISSN